MASDNDDDDAAAYLVNKIRESLKSLGVQRAAIESEAEAIVSELTTPGQNDNGAVVPPMGIDTPLVDHEGYPRNDIDVYRARSLRGRLSILRNDYKSITKELDTKLQQLALLQNPKKAEEEKRERDKRIQKKPKPKYDPVSGKWVVQNWDGSISGVPQGEGRSFSDVGSGSGTSIDGSRNNEDPDSTSTRPNRESSIDGADFVSSHTSTMTAMIPFARVDEVTPLSPAAEAGLQVGDYIVQFGSIELSSTTTTSQQALQEMGALVPQVAGEGGSLALVVLRQQQDTRIGDEEATSSPRTTVSLTLRPHPWQGRGLLGCHVVPLSKEESRSDKK